MIQCAEWWVAKTQSWPATQKSDIHITDLVQVKANVKEVVN